MMSPEQVPLAEEGSSIWSKASEKASKSTLSWEHFITDISVLICCPSRLHQPVSCLSITALLFP